MSQDRFQAEVMDELKMQEKPSTINADVKRALQLGRDNCDLQPFDYIKPVYLDASEPGKLRRTFYTEPCALNDPDAIPVYTIQQLLGEKADD
jgi:hypothetical protein